MQTYQIQKCTDISAFLSNILVIHKSYRSVAHCKKKKGFIQSTGVFCLSWVVWHVSASSPINSSYEKVGWSSGEIGNVDPHLQELHLSS